MTFPAILSATGNTVTALVGFGVALLLAFYEKGLMTVAICASLAVYLCQFFLG
jgi:CBS-domain-containing membrane protein